MKLIVVGLAILMCFSASGQNFISSDKQWNVRLSGFPPSIATEINVINGDSTVDMTVYQKLWTSFDSLATWQFQGLIREESNTVYFIPPAGNEGVLYDFNLTTGDTAYVTNIFCSDVPIHIIDVDTVEYFGASRKRWHIGENGYVDEYWIEGIGSLNGLLYANYSYCIVCPVWELLCYHENDTLKYIMPNETDCYQNTVGIGENKGETEFSVSPNPVRKGHDISVETRSETYVISVFNSAGQLMKTIYPGKDLKISIATNTLEPGLYFIMLETDANKMRTKKILVE